MNSTYLKKIILITTLVTGFYGCSSDSDKTGKVNFSSVIDIQESKESIAKKELTDSDETLLTALQEIQPEMDIQKTEEVKEITASSNELIADYLARGAVWQASSAYSDGYQSGNLLQFMEFDINGSLTYSFFNGEQKNCFYQVQNSETVNDNEYKSTLVLYDFYLGANVFPELACDMWIMTGSNLVSDAQIDYSSLMLTFNENSLLPLTYNESGTTLLTTSGLSSKEANDIIAESYNKQYDSYPNITIDPTGDISWEECVLTCWNFFLNKGLSEEQTAGILGNIQQESDFKYQCTSSSGRYFGLFQLMSQRKEAMFEMGGDKNLLSQLEYIWLENFTTDSEYSNKNYMALQNNTFGTDPRGGCIDFNEPGHSVEEYAVAWMMNVERCYTPETGWQQTEKRVSYAQQFYDLLRNSY